MTKVRMVLPVGVPNNFLDINHIDRLNTLIAYKRTEEAIELIKDLPAYLLSRRDSKYGRTPLIQAVVYENVPVMEFLFDKEVDPNITDRIGFDVFRHAIETRNPVVMGVVDKHIKSSYFSCC